MSRQTCTKCARTLPLDSFQRAGKQGRDRACMPCRNDQRRISAPLPAVERDPVEVHINNTFNLWHGPVRRALLRIAA